jgi:hypothetical protein
LKGAKLVIEDWRLRPLVLFVIPLLPVLYHLMRLDSEDANSLALARPFGFVRWALSFNVLAVTSSILAL